METRVKDLTVGELQSIITDTIKSALEDLLEDIAALSSNEMSICSLSKWPETIIKRVM